MSNQVFNPGCALVLYKPEFVKKIHDFLEEEIGDIKLHSICCHYEPKLPKGTKVINVCAGCNKRFSSLYDGVTTISLWELLATSEKFSFPDYKGMELAVHDACPVRKVGKVHEAVRVLLKRMNITAVEPERTQSNSVCCGDDFYEKIPLEKVHEKMRKRADSMPFDNVCVYCVSCIKSMHIGGKNPRYLLDLLFNEETDVQVYDTVEWHKMLDEYKVKSTL
jgi:Fe-S oxidoreductase